MTFDQAKLREELIREEKRVLHAYQDHRGFWTIGVGRLIDRRRGGGISVAESDVLLDNDIAARVIALDHALPWWRKLSDARQRALLNMAFQMGVPGLLMFRNTLRLLQAGQYDQAADNALASKWAREQTPERARRVTDLLRNG